jgi:hypothetical protein
MLVLSVEMPECRRTPKIGDTQQVVFCRRKYVHAAQNRAKNAVLRYLRHSSDIVSDADFLRSSGNPASLSETT